MGCKGCVEMDNTLESVTINHPEKEPKTYSFDAVYDMDSLQQSVYDESCFNMIDSVIKGFNGTIFAYGQTGCGKTFSMEGVRTDENLKGIIPRAFDHIFSCISQQDSNSVKYLVECAYIEIYCEEVRDLMSKTPTNKMELKMNKDGGFYVVDVTRRNVKSPAEVMKVFEDGQANRSVASTAMNASSSRSHSVFNIWIETETIIDGKSYMKSGRLNLVDLAGSERQSKTRATGQTLEEAKKINSSLTALGNVITALVDQANGKDKHIPYRESKLTLLLKDSLGGNTKTLMLCALSPADDNYDETLSTLRYANRAKQIKNKPKINEDPKDAILNEYKAKILEYNSLLNDPDALAKYLQKMNPGMSTENFDEERKKYEERIGDLQSRILDKDSLSADNSMLALKNMYSNGIMQNLLKKEKDEKLAIERQAQEEKDKLLLAQKESLNSVEEWKAKYEELAAKYKALSDSQNEELHENAEDKGQLNELVEDLNKELKFSRTIMFSYVSEDKVIQIRQEAQYDTVNQVWVFPESLNLKQSTEIESFDKKIESVPIKEVNVDEDWEAIKKQKMDKAQEYMDELLFSDATFSNPENDGGLMGAILRLSPKTFWFMLLIFIIFLTGTLCTITYVAFMVESDASYSSSVYYQDRIYDFVSQDSSTYGDCDDIIYLTYSDDFNVKAGNYKTRALGFGLGTLILTTLMGATNVCFRGFSKLFDMIVAKKK